MLYFAENSPRKRHYNLELGGGANSLDSPKIGENSDFESAENDSDLIKKNDKEEDAISEYTYKTYDDYFIDYNITADTITQDDLTGSGSLSNPYVVYSTKGFLYLSNYSLSKKSFNNAYLEIKCDIILNDESFDEDGNPSSGDGIVYAWKSISTGNNAVINGNNFHLKGLYYSNDEQVTSNCFKGLFGNIVLGEVKNLFCENFYINCFRYVYSIAYEIIEGRNLHILSGTLKSVDFIAGISRLATELYYCTNFANLFAQASAINGGLIGGLRPYGFMYNCQNYGEIQAGEQTGGIVGKLYSNSTVENCQNYGFINGKNYHTGGIVGYSEATTIATIKNSQNYGPVTSAKSAIAGVCASTAGNLQILSCANYGKVWFEFDNGSSSGEIISNIIKPKTILIIKDTQVVSENGIPFIGGQGSADGSTIKIKDCSISIENANLITKGIIFNSFWVLVNVDVENLEVNFKGENFNLKLFVFFDPGSVISMKNIIFNIDCQKNTTTNYIKEKQSGIIEVNVGDILINSNENGVEKKYYYGSDFSDFYVDWKTGKIGLKELSGKGFFQNTLTEEMLIAKKYVKKEFSA